MSEFKKRKYCWLIRNSANIATSLRFLIPVVLFLLPWEIEQKMLISLILASTDLFDGWLARKFGNSNGIGEKLDPIADKITILSSFLYLFKEGFVDENLFYLISISEIFTSIIVGVKARTLWSKGNNSNETSITMSVENLFLFLKSRGKRMKEVNKSLYVTRFGRSKVACYFLGAMSIYINFVFKVDNFQYFSVVLLWVGLLISIVVIITYLFEINWQKIFSD